MPHIVNAAPGDIRSRLWTLYWMVRFLGTSKQFGDWLTKAGIMVELGTRDGDSTRTILSAIEDLNDGTILWSFDIEHCMDRVLRRTREIGIPWPKATWSCHQQSSIEAGKTWQGGPVDMVYVDTNHEFTTTRQELLAWSPHVRRGGCMAFHDYWLAEPPRDGVKPAVDEFHGANYESWVLECHDAAPAGDTGFAVLWRIK